MLLPKNFIPGMPQTLNAQSPLSGEAFDRRVDMLPKQQASGSSSDIQHPFKLMQSGADAIGVLYGVCNNVVPTLGGVSLSLYPTQTLTSSGTYLCYLQAIYGDDGVITSCTINFAIGAIPAFDDNNDYTTIGEVDFDGTDITDIRQAATHSLYHGICGRVIEESVITEPGIPYFWGF